MQVMYLSDRGVCNPKSRQEQNDVSIACSSLLMKHLGSICFFDRVTGKCSEHWHLPADFHWAATVPRCTPWLSSNSPASHQHCRCLYSCGPLTSSIPSDPLHYTRKFKDLGWVKNPCLLKNEWLQQWQAHPEGNCCGTNQVHSHQCPFV